MTTNTERAKELLPCSCDDADKARVRFYGHAMYCAASNIEAIAQALTDAEKRGEGKAVKWKPIEEYTGTKRAIVSTGINGCRLFIAVKSKGMPLWLGENMKPLPFPPFLFLDGVPNPVEVIREVTPHTAIPTPDDTRE